MRQGLLEPDLVPYSLVCGKGRQWSVALGTFLGMQLLGLQLALFIYGVAARACEKGQQWVQAFALLGEVCTDCSAPNVIPCSAAISACDKCTLRQHAASLSEETGGA
mmetsp:Transcript_146055/g.452709  ORF Transcript_146055/g.452709 Transcript_146055/m.452709 type:complete len:107 (+) Transcript_146055:92-412(+)